MIAWMMVAWAGATSSDATSTCAPGQVVAIRPADGAVVSPDVIAMAEVSGNCGLPWVDLQDATGTTVETLQTVRLPLVQWAPTAPLAEGTYHLVTTDYADGGLTTLSTFEVSATAPPPVEPPTADLVVAADRVCTDVLTTTITADLELPGDPDAWGVATFEVSTESGVQATADFLWTGGPLSFAASVLGGREACATVAMSDALGQVVWTSDRTCAEAFAGCPEDTGIRQEEDAAGCGCSTSGSAAWALGPAILLVLRRRHRHPVA